MAIKRLAFAALAASALLPGAIPAGRLEAQVTTGSITGVVTNEANQPVPGVQVQVRSGATGVSRGAVTRDDGRYFVAGLEVGGGYSVTARRIGFAPVNQSGVRVSLGQAARVDLRLQSQAAQLSTVQVTAAASATSAIIAPDRRDVRTTFSDTAILRLPTISRNFTDFVGLTPQLSTNGSNGFSGGTNNKYNTVRIDGANATDLFGLGSTGQPGGQANGRSVPIEAIKEYQVLLTPFDVRQGQFAGAVINAVTKSGTNTFDGSILGTTRNQNFSQNVPVIRQQPFTQSNYGATLGGPIMRDKAFFFVSTEFQHQNIVASGPYVGQPAGSPQPIPVADADVARFQQILGGYGLTNIGVPTQVRNANPLANVFARTDFNLSGSTRLVLRYNYAAAKLDVFSRGATQLRFSNNGYNFQNSTNAPLLQLYSNFANGNYNELFAGLTRTRDKRVVPIVAPQVSVQVTSPTGGTSTIQAGTDNSSQGNSLDQDVYELTDNFSFSTSNHRVTVGTQNQFYKVRNLFSQNSYGNYLFGTLDSLAAGTPRTYTVGVRLGGTPDARFRTGNYSAYVQDEWTLSNRFNVQYGVRLDLPVFYNAPGFNSTIDSVKAYGRETNQKPASRLEFSPRLGFNYDVFGNQSLQLRGGTGLFAGLPPYVFLSNVFGNSGVDTYGNFSCPNASSAPAFTADPAQQPTACRPGSTATQNPYNINTLDPKLKLPQYFKASLGADRALGAGYVLTVEGLYTRAVNGLFYQNLAIQTVTGTDRNGRLLYGDYRQQDGNTIPYTVEFNPNIVSTRPGQSSFAPDGRRNLTGRLNVIDATNQSKDYAYSITGGVRKRYSNRFEGSLFYTYGRTYDVQSLTSSVALSNWQFGRAIAGSQYDRNVGVSVFDQPHRIVASGTYTLPTKTDLSLVYFGQSGGRYNFTYSQFDANMDGSGGNDLIYVPKDVFDPKEITFTAPRGTPAANVAASIAAQQAAFDRLISTTDCLSKARGTILGRNACQQPFTHLFNVNVTQAVPTIRGQNVEARLDILNLGNLLNRSWGKQPSLTTTSPLVGAGAVGTTGNYASAIGPNGGQQQFTFNPAYQLYAPTNPQITSQAPGAYYQIQLGLAYRF